MRRLERPAIAILVIALIAVPSARHGLPTSGKGYLFTGTLVAGGCTLIWWRGHPRLVTILGSGLWLLTAAFGADGWFPDTALVFLALFAATAAIGWSGRAAWLAAAGVLAYLWVLALILGATTSDVALLMFTVPGFAAGTVYRLYAESAVTLERRNSELQEERELFAELAVRHERARIASELHDIVGHAISVMVIQAAAGQRLVDGDPARAKLAFAAIAESARQGREDLGRLIELLSGTEVAGPDLSMIEEVVSRAAGSGLDVSCRFDGDRDGVPAPAAHVAFRVVQESLTNALRYAPGAAVRVLVSGTGRSLTVSVENDVPVQARPGLTGTGRGLAGLRERVQEAGGRLRAGPTAGGGWRVEASLPDFGISR
jgi:signal transduction histidine kinase